MSGVIDGQAVSAAITNPAFLDANGDDTALGKIDLDNAPVDPASGPKVVNTQREINSLDSFTGRSAGSVYNAVPSYTNNDVGSVGDPLKDRADALTQKFNPTTGHSHDGTAGEGPKVEAFDLADVPYRGYIFQGTDIIGATTGSTDVSSLLIGKSASTSSTTLGVVVNNPQNKVLLRHATGASANDDILDAFGNIVYGRLTEAATVWTLTYYVLLADVETAFTLPGSTDIRWYYQELFNPMGISAPTYSEYAITPSDNSTADVVDASITQRGVVSTGTQSFAGNKTFTGDLSVNGTTTLGDSNADTTTIRGTPTLTDSSSTKPLVLGADVNLYRSAADVLKTDDSLTVALDLTVNGTTTLGDSNADTTTIRGTPTLTDSSSTKPLNFGADVNLYRSLANRLKTDDSLEIAQFLGLTPINDNSSGTIIALAPTSSLSRLTNAATKTLQGIVAGLQGDILCISNNGAGDLTLQHNNAGAVAANRLFLQSGSDLTIAQYGAAWFYYDTTDSKWIFIASTSGSTSGFVTLTGTQTLTNKDYDGGVASNTRRITVPSDTKVNLDALTRKEGTIVYATDTDKLYTDNGTILVEVGSSGGGGGGSLQWLEKGNSPILVDSSFFDVYEFDAGFSQALYTSLKVPSSYVAGNPIKLKSDVLSSDTTNNILFQTIATLIRPGIDAVSSTTNQRTSTNSAISLSAGTVNIPQSVTFDLSSTIGQINGVAIAAGDLILIKLLRGTDTSTSNARAMVYDAETTFT